TGKGQHGAPGPSRAEARDRTGRQKCRGGGSRLSLGDREHDHLRAPHQPAALGPNPRPQVPDAAVAEREQAARYAHRPPAPPARRRARAALGRTRRGHGLSPRVLLRMGDACAACSASSIRATRAKYLAARLLTAKAADPVAETTGSPLEPAASQEKGD